MGKFSEVPEALLELPDGRRLSVELMGSQYSIVDPRTGSKERIDLQRAALLWQRGKSEGWPRVEGYRAKQRRTRAEAEDEIEPEIEDKDERDSEDDPGGPLLLASFESPGQVAETGARSGAETWRDDMRRMLALPPWNDNA